ncbi:hypothetical protein BWD42_07055 [Sphingobacterium sp. CZ-UAM]|uniref:hypothetical protein n=1 Tax=Sphingobacterium sp. CZ-UAM TaxID=1933868 RepID=UPI00098763D8|nr:hypothetical protein [Sphingobacterium sp. CZ-UAM]OOG19663.1 hypothetical protein BWD42_07055 [Sphingobacterium sp. CZ-UAM]
MILEKIKVLHKKEFAWGAKLLLFLTLISCSTQKNLDDFAEIDRYNCSSFNQRGKGYTESEVAPLIHGKVRLCYNNETVPHAKVFFIKNNKDTIASLITDKKGEFFQKISSDGFFGKVIIERFGSNLTIDEVRIDANFKDYYLDIKLPRQPAYINETGPKEDQKKLRKEVERASQKHN